MTTGAALKKSFVVQIVTNTECESLISSQLKLELLSISGSLKLFAWSVNGNACMTVEQLDTILWSLRLEMANMCWAAFSLTDLSPLSMQSALHVHQTHLSL